MEKMLYYFKTEYGYEEFDLIQQFGRDFEDLKSRIKALKLDNLQDESEEKMLFNLIDEFMIDNVQMNKRRRRAY